MSTKLTKEAYLKMIEQDIKFLDDCPNCLEKDHIKVVLYDSVNTHYPSTLKLCCDCKLPLPEGFITRCPDCYDEIYLPK